MAGLFKTLEQQQVPTVFFSAGIGNVVLEILIQQMGALNCHTHVISNMLQFGSDGVITSFSEPVIQPFNKSTKVLQSWPVRIEQRKHVLLLGDGLGDVAMAVDEEHDVVLRVGFVNHNVEELLPKYQEVFDILVLNDGSAEFLNQWMHHMMP